MSRRYLGVELGSTRIKAVLIDETFSPVAAGAFGWESRYENGYWTYSLDEAWAGVRAAYAEMAAAYRAKFGRPLTHLDGMGISGMMHGYLPFDRNGRQLAAFRTWRNTTTQDAAKRLSALFDFNVPQRWSIAHLYQAMLNGEAHVRQIARLTTLAGYIHARLTGQSVLGAGEASGMFPIGADGQYDRKMAEKFDALLREAALPFTLRDVLPRALLAGEDAGSLTAEGALLLDPTGALQPGAPLCPPEGDAGTGMTATDAVAAGTGNVSAGTSIFAMLVLSQPLRRVYPEIDMVATPDGKPVAMVHCNTCTSDLDAWVGLLGEAIRAAGTEISTDALYRLFYESALSGDADCGGLVSFNYFAGEPVTGTEAGRPLFLRRPDAKLGLGNFARCQLYAAIATLKLGMNILADEDVRLERLNGHGGLFKTPVVGQRLIAGALNVPVAVMTTAGEGGPWGMALLAAYRAQRQTGQTLADFLDRRVFANAQVSVLTPNPEDAAGFAAFLRDYTACLPVERAAAQALR